MDTFLQEVFNQSANPVLSGMTGLKSAAQARNKDFMFSKNKPIRQGFFRKNGCDEIRKNFVNLMARSFGQIKYHSGGNNEPNDAYVDASHTNHHFTLMGIKKEYIEIKIKRPHKKNCRLNLNENKDKWENTTDKNSDIIFEDMVRISKFWEEGKYTLCKKNDEEEFGGTKGLEHLRQIGSLDYSTGDEWKTFDDTGDNKYYWYMYGKLNPKMLSCYPEHLKLTLNLLGDKRCEIINYDRVIPKFPPLIDITEDTSTSRPKLKGYKLYRISKIEVGTRIELVIIPDGIEEDDKKTQDENNYLLKHYLWDKKPEQDGVGGGDGGQQDVFNQYIPHQNQKWKTLEKELNIGVVETKQDYIVKQDSSFYSNHWNSDNNLMKIEKLSQDDTKQRQFKSEGPFYGIKKLPENAINNKYAMIMTKTGKKEPAEPTLKIRVNGDGNQERQSIRKLSYKEPEPTLWSDEIIEHAVDIKMNEMEEKEQLKYQLEKYNGWKKAEEDYYPYGPTVVRNHRLWLNTQGWDTIPDLDTTKKEFKFTRENWNLIRTGKVEDWEKALQEQVMQEFFTLLK